MTGARRKRVMRVLYHFICLVVVFGFTALPAAEIYAASSSNAVLLAGLVLVMAGFCVKQLFYPRATFSEGAQLFVALGFTGFAFWAYGTAQPFLAGMYPVLIIVYLVGSKVHMRMHAVDNSLEIITRTTRQPVKRIISFDYRFAAVLFVLLAALTVLLFVGVVGPALSAAGRLLSSMQLRINPPGYNGLLEELPSRAHDELEIAEYLYPESLLARIMRVMYWVFGTAAFLLASGYVLTLLFKALLYYLGHREQGRPAFIPEGDYEEEKTFVLPARRRRERATANENEVRRRFRLTVRKNIRKGVPIIKSDTPEQMSHKIASEDISGLTEAYRNVRYRL
jgi:hypothetical protein